MSSDWAPSTTQDLVGLRPAGTSVCAIGRERSPQRRRSSPSAPTVPYPPLRILVLATGRLHAPSRLRTPRPSCSLTPPRVAMPPLRRRSAGNSSDHPKPASRIAHLLVPTTLAPAARHSHGMTTTLPGRRLVGARSFIQAAWASAPEFVSSRQGLCLVATGSSGGRRFDRSTAGSPCGAVLCWSHARRFRGH